MTIDQEDRLDSRTPLNLTTMAILPNLGDVDYNNETLQDQRSCCSKVQSKSAWSFVETTRIFNAFQISSISLYVPEVTIGDPSSSQMDIQADAL